MRVVQHTLRRFSYHRRWFSALSSRSEENNQLKKFLPSEAFVKQYVRRPSHRDKLASLLSELQIFLELFGKDSIPQFTDSIWTTYFGTWSAEERCEFLNQLRLEQKNHRMSKITGEKDQISVINQRREDNGEVVYAPGFNNLIELRGQEFRGIIDRMYGSRMLSLQRCEEELPKLVVDCRFLTEFSVPVQSTFVKQIQALHDSNWNSRLPFNISIANFRPDSQLSEIARRHLLFQYGPPSCTSFSRHPFAPTLTSKGVQEACGNRSQEIMYISWRATQFIPEEPPPNIRAVVLCASKDYQPWSSSISAAQKDGIKAYRLPLERYARFEYTSKYLPLNSTSLVLRSYFRGEDIGESIRKSVDSLQNSIRKSDNSELELLQRYKAVIQEAVAKAERGKSFGSKENFNRSQLLPRKPKTHRYSREERRKMREIEKLSLIGSP